MGGTVINWYRSVPLNSSYLTIASGPDLSTFGLRYLQEFVSGKGR